MPDLNWTSDGPTGSPGFDTSFHTDWLVVRTAGQPGAAASAAMEKLCRTYWYPLYAYVRRQGHAPHDAQDLTQEFFARLLATPWLQEVHPSKGKFRAFLLASMNHFLAKEWRRERAQKRGGGKAVFSLDAVEAEDRYRIEPSHGQSPDKVFERDYARTVLKQVLAALRYECFLSGKGPVFEELKGVFEGEKPADGYVEMAGRLGMTEGAVKKAAQRLRERFHALLRAEVARTVENPTEVDEEIRSLFAALVG
jgi:RNA polymerase sigma factor (sigma-70 family)